MSTGTGTVNPTLFIAGVREGDWAAAACSASGDTEGGGACASRLVAGACPSSEGLRGAWGGGGAMAACTSAVRPSSEWWGAAPRAPWNTAGQALPGSRTEPHAAQGPGTGCAPAR